MLKYYWFCGQDRGGEVSTPVVNNQVWYCPLWCSQGRKISFLKLWTQEEEEAREGIRFLSNPQCPDYREECQETIMGGADCKANERDGLELGIYRKWLKEEREKTLDSEHGSKVVCCPLRQERSCTHQEGWFERQELKLVFSKSR